RKLPNAGETPLQVLETPGLPTRYGYQFLVGHRDAAGRSAHRWRPRTSLPNHGVARAATCRSAGFGGGPWGSIGDLHTKEPHDQVYHTTFAAGIPAVE